MARTRHSYSSPAVPVDIPHVDNDNVGGAEPASATWWRRAPTTVGAPKSRRRGRPVPDDVAVVDFDDIEAAEYAEPPLTTARHLVIRTVEAVDTLPAPGGGRAAIDEPRQDARLPSRRMRARSSISRSSAPVRADGR
ncbi:substrate-binding domain-containing protein [Nonomuraea indica]|uniref:Substrate-binding domain-containing protein n=1 Tax=Nonomuraea indica TaxID=1581193 RepID=A0ABW8AHE4_9ACTN